MAKLYTKNTWVDEVLAAAERYNILEDGGTPIESNVQINLATATAVAGTAVTAEKMNNIEDGIDAIDTRVDGIDTELGTDPAGAYADVATRLDAQNPIGKKRKFFPVMEMKENGCAPVAIVETYFPVMAFDPSSVEGALFTWVFPKNFDGGDIRFRFHGIQSGTNTGDVVGVLYADSLASGTGSLAFPSAEVILEMPGSDAYVVASDWSSLFGNTFLSPEEFAVFLFRRLSTDGDDTYDSDDFQLLGVEIEYTVDAATED